MQSRINGLGVSEPEIRKQGSNQIVIQLAGVHDPAAAARAHRQDGAADALRLRERRDGPVGGRKGQRGPAAFALHAADASPGESDEGIAGGVLPLPHEDDDDEGHEEGREADDNGHALRRPRQPRVDAGRSVEAVRREGAEARGGPEGAGAHRSASRVRRRRAASMQALLGSRRPAPTTTCSSTPRRAGEERDGDPGDERLRPRPLGDARRRRSDRKSGRPAAVHRSRLRPVPEDHAGRGPRGATANALTGKQGEPRQLRAALRDRARPGTRVDAVHRLQAQPRRHPRAERARSTSDGGTIGEAKNLALVLQSGALPFKFEQIERTDVSATLGKSSLHAGEARGARRPDHRRALPAAALPLPRPRRGDRPRDLRRSSTTRRSCSSTSR